MSDEAIVSFPEEVTLQIIDVAEFTRWAYGGQERASATVGHTVPEHDYRFRVTVDSGAEVTFAQDTTAAQMIAYLRSRGDIT